MKTKTKLHIPGAPFNMGDRVKSYICGFEGIVTAHTRHLTGCDTVWVASETQVHDGKAVGQYFDVLEVERLEENPLDIQGFPEDVPSSG